MPRVRPRRRSSRLLPVVLLGALAASGGGLVALGEGEAPGAGPEELLAAAALPVPVPTVTPAPVEVLARATRSRRLAEAQQAQQARAAEQARQRAAQAARARAAAARAAAAREAQRRLQARACPVPSATFVDSWGFSRSGGRSHRGTDLIAAYGAPVYAVRAGVVRTGSGGKAGLSIRLRATDGDVYFYAHNSANLVSSGERVEAGQLIARVGTSGNAAGGPPHVHFELQPGGGRAVPSYAFLREIC